MYNDKQNVPQFLGRYGGKNVKLPAALVNAAHLPPWMKTKCIIINKMYNETGVVPYAAHQPQPHGYKQNV